MALGKLVRHCGLTYIPLWADLTFAIKEWQRDQTSQFWCRTSIRCFCAVVEAALFGYRKMADQMAALSKVQFDPKEVEILAGKQIKNGVERPKWLSPADSVKESFRLFGKAVGCPIALNYGDDGFRALCKTFEIRNRLMHPKEPFDVEVRVGDMKTADHAIKWFNNSHASVIEQCQAHVDKSVEKMKKQH